ncbi:hypothetical protein GCM10011386_39210 [Parapedobacter defluvii]|uniref:Uncharacterized protein n=1 Tax=Parapedobacter defluvii TaxID=2045106 RepID=A0ABQ1MMC6_9SPHI|nr:hypothetical protein [Parapedobacter defluvii]GGC43100.1 hypothetical protein GCM10011386_39210 [Parapedobacter defluvii]
MTNEERFIEKSKLFRLHFGLSEEEIDAFLSNKNLKYKGLELGSRTLTLELAEAYPLIYGIEYCEFKKEDIAIPALEDLPKATQNYIQNKENSGNRVGSKGTKNKASYVTILINDFPIGHKFTNSEIIPSLPSPANKDKSIDWGKGLLKGIVKNTKTSRYYIDKDGKKHREAIYEIVKSVDPLVLDKAKENVGEEWLKGVQKKKRN